MPKPGRWGAIPAMTVAASLLAFSPAGAQSQRPTLASRLPEPAVRQIEALMAEKAQRTTIQQKISSRLLQEARIRRGEPIANGVTTMRTGLEVVGPDGLVEVDIKAQVSATVLQRINDVGGTVINSVPSYQAIRARVPLNSVEAIATLPEVRFIKPADRSMTHGAQAGGAMMRAATGDAMVNAKTNTSQGDVAHRANLARSFYGVNGAGIGIGVLSDGVNTLVSRQATGDLPSVMVLPGQAGWGDEGTAMLEIVYDLAPGANLFFATANGGQAQFAGNIQALCNAGARVIVDDFSYFDEAVFQDGIVAQGINSVTANGCFLFSAAGNEGNFDDGTAGVWEGDFVQAASLPPGTLGGTAHNFGGGSNSDLITAGGLTFILQWSDPLGGSGNDYDLYLFDSTMSTILAASTDVQNGTQDPVESICSLSCGFNHAGDRLVVVKYSGAGRYLHLNTFRGTLTLATAGQTAGHGAAANAFGVAAVDVATAGGGPFIGGSANSVETYSSDGPRRIFFNPNGTPITPGNFSSTGGQVLQKPDIAAADRVSTATPGFRPSLVLLRRRRMPRQ